MNSNKDVEFINERNTYWAIIVVVIASYISVAISHHKHSLLEWVILILIGLIFFSIQVFGMATFSKSRLGLFFYFGAQILLGMLALYLSQGSTFLLMMPIPSIAVCLLPLGGAVFVGCSIVLAETLVAGIGSGWVGVGENFMMIVSSVFFVMAFTQVAVKEQEVRTEAEQLAEKLGEANQKLREYAVQVEELAVANERNRISREIHDSLGHYLTAIHMQINAAKAVFGQDSSKAMDAMNKAQNLALESLSEVRRAVAALRITPLEGKQLLLLIQELVDSSNASGIRTSFQITGEPRHLDSPIELAIYRVIQEGLTNVRKHSNAKNAEVVLEYTDANFVRLLIKDDGDGTVVGKPSGFGLIGLRERLSLCGGELSIATGEGVGFTLEAVVPG